MLIELQRNFNNAPPPGGAGAGAAPDPLAIILMLVFYAVIIIIALAVQIMFLLSLSKTLKAIAPDNRDMEPGQVWLNLIPFFNLIWMILTILRVSDSLKKEFESQGIRGDGGDYGKTVGLVYIISALVGCSCVSIVAWIMYWVKIVNYRKQIEGGGGSSSSGRRRRRDDDDDDRDDRD